MTNLLNKGSVRYIVFKEDNVWYAAALEFNIVEEGKTPEAALVSLFNAINGYAASASKAGLSASILNQKTDPEYEKMWQALQKPQTSRLARTEPTVFTFGQTALAAV